VISGWYGNAYHWAGVGSKECEDVVEVRFEEVATLSFTGTEGEAAQQARHALAEGFYPLWDFHGRFHGVLTQRAVRHPMSPSLDEMHYLLTVQRVDGIQIERAAWKSAPPPPPPN
jgi:hypothetical protein